MTTSVKMTDQEVDDFLTDLLNDQSKPKNRLNKLTMTSNANKGTVMFVIIPEGSTGKFYGKLESVREVNQFTELNEKIDGDCWHKILPKSAYKNLSEEDSMLYDQCVTLFDKLYESGAWGYDLERAGVARYRTYGLFYGYILRHINEKGNPVRDGQNNLTSDHVSLMMYPTNKVIDALGAAITAKKLASGGSTTWLPRYLSRATVGRTGAVTIKTSGGKGGYDVSITFEANSEDNPYVVPADLDLTDSFEKCQDFVKDFLGWQGDDDNGYFNRPLFLEIREYLTGYFLEDGKTINPEYLKGVEEQNSDEQEESDPLA